MLKTTQSIAIRLMAMIFLGFGVIGLSNHAFAQAPDTNPDAPENRDAEDVISIYGAAYDNISDINYDPNWGQSGHNQVNPAFDPGTGNVILAYPNFNYQGTVFPEQNAASMEFLHVSIWVPEGTNRMVKVSPIDFSGTGPGEVLVEVPLSPGEWNSVSLPIEDFGGMTWQAVRELKFDGQFNADGSANTDPFDVYLDNIFFWKTADTPESDATLSDLQIDGETIENFDPAVQKYTVSLVAGTTTIPQITAATSTNDNASVTITQATEIPGEGNVSVVSEDESRERIYTVSFIANIPGEGAPAQPARNASDVISIFSDRYNDIEVDTFSADFDDSEIEDVTIDGTPAKRIDFGNFIAIDFQSNRQDASAMTHFHMNFWTGEADLIGKVFNSKFSQWGGGAGEVSAMELNINTGTNPELVSGTWVTVDVPISDFTGNVTRDDLAQFLITSNLDVAYVANIYLYREGELIEPEIEAFSLLSPADGTSLSLTGDGSDEATIEWEEAESNVDVTYVWHADTPGSDFSDPAVSISSDNSGTATSLTLTFGALDQALAGLGVNQGESITLDWTVTAMAGDSVRFAEMPFSITLTRDLDVSNDGNLVTNGDFEAGEAPWFGNALNVRTEGDNSFNFADVEVAGQPFDVNLSQVVDLTPGESYVFTFDASTGAGHTRDMIVGIGLNQAPWYAATETVTLTETIQTFSVDLVATDDGDGGDFGDAESRVLFDMGADAGIVVIDNVSLVVADETSTGVDESPHRFELSQNYPNPFNPTTNISYSIPTSGDVTIEVFNVMGQRVATLVNENVTAGNHTVAFDASALASGIYMYRLQAGSTVLTKKMTLIK